MNRSTGNAPASAPRKGIQTGNSGMTPGQTDTDRWPQREILSSPPRMNDMTHGGGQFGSTLKAVQVCEPIG